MNALAQVLWDPQGDLLGDYVSFVDAIEVSPAQRSQRKAAARRFLERHADPAVWMASRPTATRLVDLHRLKAWPWLTWLMVSRRVRPDLELLLAKPPGVDVGLWWTVAYETVWVPETRPWSLTCRDGGRC